MKSELNLTARQVARITGGRYFGSDSDADELLGEAVIDSRKVTEGSLYVPIIGERFDGHDFIENARASGAALVLTDRPLAGGAPYVLVDDMVPALQLLAGYHRSGQRALVVGVTGSAGKTTTKEMVACVLEQGGATLRTEGNLNNQTGVPQMLFRLHPSHAAAVFEMGMNHAGEIDRLAAMVRPDIGVITNIGTAHIEYLGSREGIFAAKTEMLPYVVPGGTVFVNGDDDLLQSLTYPNLRVVTFGFSKRCDLRAEDVRSSGLEGTVFIFRSEKTSFELRLPFPGRYLVYSALAAAGCGLCAGLAPDRIAEGIASYRPAGSRMRIIRGEHGTIIDDTYNANLPAILAALEVLQRADGPRVAVLGEMRELGDASAEHHKKAVRAALESGTRVVLTTGEEFRRPSLEAADLGAPVKWYETQETLIEELPEVVRPGDTVLVKGSRGMHMENTVEKLLSM